MKKIGKMGEVAWILGNIICALGVALCTKASFGLSMMAAVPYVIHLAVSEYLPFYTQGVSEYVVQAMVFVIICIVVRRVRLKYFLSIITSVIFGILIDCWIFILGGGGAYSEVWMRIVAFVLGELSIALSIALYFRTYLPIQIAETLVTEISRVFNLKMDRVKLINDIGYLVLAVTLSLLLTENFKGVGIGTIIITIVNAPLIKLFGRLLDKTMSFEPIFPKVNAWIDKL
jgi:uncharacterized membrane protein YczE